MGYRLLAPFVLLNSSRLGFLLLRNAPATSPRFSSHSWLCRPPPAELLPPIFPMLFFVLATAVLGLLVYYVARSEERETSEESRPRGTANRDRNLDRRTRGESKTPQIHRQKVGNMVQEALRRAKSQAKALLEEGRREKLVWRVYFCAESTREMFCSNEFFGRGQRRHSFKTALDAAEDARNTLIEKQRKAARRKEMTNAKDAAYIKDKCARTAVESALVIAWCAGGLIGKGRHESAREVFGVSVSAEDTRDWDRFVRCLQKERERRMADSQMHVGPAQ